MNTSMSLSAVVALIFILLGVAVVLMLVAVCYISKQVNEHEQEVYKQYYKEEGREV